MTHRATFQRLLDEAAIRMRERAAKPCGSLALAEADLVAAVTEADQAEARLVREIHLETCPTCKVKGERSCAE